MYEENQNWKHLKDKEVSKRCYSLCWEVYGLKISLNLSVPEIPTSLEVLTTVYLPTKT